MNLIKRTKQAVAAILMLLAVACSKHNDVLAPPPVIIDTTAPPQHIGMFSNGPYGRVSGRVAIYKQNDSTLLSLKDFTTSSGPDLHVYLAAEQQPVHFIDLGKLRQTTGDQVYIVPGKPDLIYYTYALIHCQQFNHLFGSARLK